MFDSNIPLMFTLSKITIKYLLLLDSECKSETVD